MKKCLFFVAVAILFGISIPTFAQKSKLFKIDGVLTAISENPAPRKRVDTLDLNLKIESEIFLKYAHSISFLIDNKLDTLLVGPAKEKKGEWISPFILTINQVFPGVLIMKDKEIIFKENIKMEKYKNNYFFIFSAASIIFNLIFFFKKKLKSAFPILLFAFMLEWGAAFCCLYYPNLWIVTLLSIAPILVFVFFLLFTDLSFQKKQIFEKGKAKTGSVIASIFLLLTASVLMYFIGK